MRFDDRIQTVLAWVPGDDASRARLWRQLVDLVATDEGRAEAALLDAAYARLAELDRSVTAAHRAIAAAQVGEGAPMRLLRSLGAATSPADAEPTLDLDLSYAIDTGPAPDADGAPSQIIDLLARIDAFQARQRDTAEAGFAFRIDRDGRLRDSRDGALPASVAEPPLGVDGHAAGAWREGVAFSDARLSIDHGPYAGEWRISAAPEHDAAGKHVGYAGDARRPRPDETAVVQPAEADLAPEQTEPPGEIDAAIDRLRDPLEAIARLANAAMLPAGEMREAVRDVAERSAALRDALDALEVAVAVAGEGGLDAAALLVRIDGALQPLAQSRGLRMSFRLARGLPPVDADPQAVERMIARLVGSIVSLGRRGEHVVARLGRDRRDGRMLALSITRPGRFLGRPAQALLDPPDAPGADAPELGLGFALRLVDRLAQEAGGTLTIHHDRIVLSLPLRTDPPTLVRARRA